MTITRITVAFDRATAELLEKLSREMDLSQSEIMRRALRFYNENKVLTDPSIRKKAFAYMDLLLSGEHVILDLDHWLLFLNLIETSPEQEKFWKAHREIAQSHREQLKSRIRTAEEILNRLETCNFFRITKNSDKDFTLILGGEVMKKFVKILIEEFFSAIGVKAEVKENLSKLNVTIKP
ncbi:MAG: ribbon-helix-helix protein, CopG family [Candidatus Bathyarchaeia archaeon]